MFINQGIRSIREYSINEKEESRTMVVFKEGYSQTQIEAIEKSVKEFGGTLKIIDSADELISYINNKNNDRSRDKITNLDFFSHGLVGSIEFGYSIDGKASSYRLNWTKVRNISKDAFDGYKATITSYACRTGTSKEGELLLNNNRKLSFAQLLSNVTATHVRAFERRSSYTETLGTRLDRYFNWPVEKPVNKIIDGAAFTPQGANRPVVGGDFPMGTSSELLDFNPYFY